jgi:hypothetical protein
MLQSEREADAHAAQAYMGFSGMAFITARLASVTLMSSSSSIIQFLLLSWAAHMSPKTTSDSKVAS